MSPYVPFKKMNIRNVPIKHIHAVTVRMKRRYNMDETQLQYGWNPVPVGMEPVRT